MIPIVRLFALVAAALFCGGCHFENPLTAAPSKNLNTWLLGVWEHKAKDGQVSSVTVTPLTCDRFSVRASIAGNSPKAAKKYEFEGWISHVGDTSFLTLRCRQSPGDIPAGACVFVQAQMLDQNNVRVHGLHLESPASATSFELRKEVRQRLKDRSLYDTEKSSNWRRVEEVAWFPDGETPSFTPLRNGGEIPTLRQQIKNMTEGTL